MKKEEDTAFNISISFIHITSGAIYSALGLGDNRIHMRRHPPKKQWHLSWLSSSSSRKQ